MTSKIFAFVLPIIFFAGMAVPVFQLLPLGLPDGFKYLYLKNPDWDPISILFAALPAICNIGFVTIILFKKQLPSRKEIPLCLIVIVLNSFLFHVACSTLLSQYGTADALYNLMQQYGDGSYLLQAENISDFPAFVDNLAEDLAGPAKDYFPHRRTHPPGFTGFFYAIGKLVQLNAPGVHGLRAMFWDNSPLLREMFIQSKNPVLIYIFTTVVITAAVSLWLFASILPIPVYIASRQYLGPKASLITAVLSTLYPSSHLFNPATDQLLLFVSSLLFLLGVAAIVKRNYFLSLLFGIGFGVSLNFSLALGILGVIFVLHALLEFLRCRKITSNLDPAFGQSHIIVRLLLRSGSGLAIALAFFHFVCGMNLPQVIMLCLKNNQEFNVSEHRPYFFWLLLQPLENAYSAGIPLVCIFIGAIICRLFQRQRPFLAHPSDSFLWAITLTMILLSLSGVNRGETGRLWLFLYPALTLALFTALRQKEVTSPIIPIDRMCFPPEKGIGISPALFWTFLLVSQVIQTIVLRIVVDVLKGAHNISGVV